MLSILCHSHGLFSANTSSNFAELDMKAIATELESVPP
jgi:hypothetical protein